MIHRDLVLKPGHDPLRHHGSQADFRYQEQNLSSLFQGFLCETQKNLRFPRSRHTMEKKDRGFGLSNLLQGLHLARPEFRRDILCRQRDEIPVLWSVNAFQESFFQKRAGHGSRNPSGLCCGNR